LKVGSIVIDCEKFDAMFAFWQETLHYRPREPAEGGWVVLADPEGRGRTYRSTTCREGARAGTGFTLTCTRKTGRARWRGSSA